MKAPKLNTCVVSASTLKRLRKQVKELKEDNDELNAIFNLQRKRMGEATKLWQLAHPEQSDTWPDLGDLLQWLMDRINACTDAGLRHAAKLIKLTMAVEGLAKDETLKGHPGVEALLEMVKHEG